MKRQSGFTLVELMVVIALIAIMAGIAVPSYNVMVANNRITTTQNYLVSALNLARSESIKRSVPVQVERIHATDWREGWQVRVAGGAVLREFPAPPGRTVVEDGASPTVFTGMVSEGTTTSFTIRDDSNVTTQARCVRVAPTGRVSSENQACI